MVSRLKTLLDLRVYVVGADDQGADYHAREDGHWINSTVIANPMSKYPAYHDTRSSWGIDVLGSVMVEVEASDGSVGFAVIPLPYGPAHGEWGLAENIALAQKWRDECGPGFMLAFDCFMALTAAYSLQLIERLEPLGFYWIEECLSPDDYDGYAKLVAQRSHPILIRPASMSTHVGGSSNCYLREWTSFSPMHGVAG